VQNLQREAGSAGPGPVAGPHLPSARRGPLASL